MKTLPILLSFFLLLGFVNEGQAQNQRPRIGLVLAGGGAKGLAHIGVIKVLEEAGFDVDIVAGTSMGSIIGGLYAMGYNSETMYQEVANIDWNKLMTQAPDPATQPLLNWEANQQYQLKLPLVDSKPSLPSGFNNGQKIYLMLTYLSENFHEVRNFNDLPREFFCIACDYYTGEEVLLDSGYVPDAMRASMSIPSFFTPVKLNNHILIDGGWINNFPVERMKERNVDFIIGVDFPRQAYDLDADFTLLDVMMESNSYVNVRYNDVNRALCDVLIIPELGKISSTNYELADTIVKIGEATARKQFEKLKFLADSLGIVQRNFPNPLPVNARQVNEVTLQGLSETDLAVVENNLYINYTGPALPKQYLAVANNLYGTEDFEQVSYKLLKTNVPTDGYNFEVRLKAKKNPASLNMAINFTNDFKVSMLLNYTHRNLFFPGYRLQATAIVSESPVVKVQYYSAMGRKWLPAGEVAFYRYLQPLYVEGTKFSQYVYQNFYVRGYMQSNLNVNTVAGGGLEYQRTEIYGDAFDLFGLSEDAFNMLNAKMFFKHSNQRNLYFATKGIAVNGEVYASSDLNEGFFVNPYLIYNLGFQQDFTLNSKWAIRYKLHSGNTLNRTLTAPNSYYVGGYGLNYTANIEPFFGYNRMELLVTDGFHSATAEVHFQFLPNHYIKAIGNVGATIQQVDFKNLRITSTYVDGIGGGYAYNSPLGPLQFFAAKSTLRKEWLFYLYLGYWF